MFHQLYSLCTATKDIKFTAASTKKKKRRREEERCSMPVFNQSFVFHMAQFEEPDRKRAQFSKVDGDFMAKIRDESVPAAAKRTTSSWVNVFRNDLSE